MQVDMAILSILAVVIVFVIGAFKQNPLHLGILGMFVAFVIGKAAGIADTTIMGFFPTTLFVRVFGIMFFFAIAQANGAIELLAKKMIAKFGANARLMPFVLFYVGVILGSIGINSLAGMAILGGIGVSLAAASGADPLLYGMAGGYGIACGCYSPLMNILQILSRHVRRLNSHPISSVSICSAWWPSPSALQSSTSAWVALK